MNNNKERKTKPASNDPVKEARSHPDGPGLDEMLNGQEEKKPKTAGNSKKITGSPDIPII
jgi:hypothetical protein